MSADTPQTATDELARSRAETRGAFENRAQVYFYIFDELRAEVGRERAIEVMKRAIHRRGLEVGKKYRPAAEAGDLAEVGRLFCDTSPCGGALFSPGVEELTADVTVLRMESCPLKDAWEAMGLSPEEIDTLCEVAAAVDEGTFEGAGLELTFLDRLGRPGASRCLLRLSLPDTE